MAKRLIDFSRLEFVHSKLNPEAKPLLEGGTGEFKVAALEYCDPVTESPECTLLLAFKN